eukprot:gnl/Trimastix_PCT/373.p2 GENE.gnl/Trimastix_PCT/373~~gnl/Trimastix_PCT/373.p2  ORF type:complete len:243 (-),score=25.60 gnl/Trimastix_PCT/373:6-734(-)
MDFVDEDYSSCSSDGFSEYSDEPWIQWFCSLKGHEFFCEVETDFIEDDFNLHGLNSSVPYYDYALDLILDVEDSELDNFSDSQRDLIQHSAEQLYGLIHARYVITPRGLEAMQVKFSRGHFGICPRTLCNETPLLPVGQHDVMRRSSVKLYCPCCNDIYNPHSRRYQALDGAFFGTTFPHLFLQTFPDLAPKKTHPSSYIPKIFGFRLYQGPYPTHAPSDAAASVASQPHTRRKPSARSSKK